MTVGTVAELRQVSAPATVLPGSLALPRAGVQVEPQVTARQCGLDHHALAAQIRRVLAGPSPLNADDRELLGAIVEMLATSTRAGRGRLGTPREAVICARRGCGVPFLASPRLRGSTRRFCSPRCRKLAWRAKLVPPSDRREALHDDEHGDDQRPQPRDLVVRRVKLRRIS